jgi:membrane protease YdiL (CAAX protease family)
MQAASTEPRSNDLPKIIAYLGAVMVGGALLAPQIAALAWWAKDALADSQLGVVKWLLDEIERAHFNRFFNRGVLVCAVLFLWPLVRSLKLGRDLMPTWQPLGRGVGLWLGGFGLAAGSLLLMGWGFYEAGAYAPATEPRWSKWDNALSAALGAGIIEEVFFRGAILGILLRTQRRGVAVFWCTFIFAFVHFLKPPVGWEIEDADIRWWSGFLVLGQIFKGFGDAQFLIAEFSTLFAVGWVLAWARLRTGQLWLSMGLHGGWIFGLKYFSGVTAGSVALGSGEWLPWIGINLKIGLVPLVMVLLTGWMAVRLFGGKKPQALG